LAAGELRFVMSVRAVGEAHISSIEFRTGVIWSADEVRIDDPGKHLVTGQASGDSGTSGASGDYQLRFPADRPLSERVIYPTIPDESRGIEDARFIRFAYDDGRITYFATYTAFDGVQIVPRLLRTDDFQTFDMTGIDVRGGEPTMVLR